MRTLLICSSRNHNNHVGEYYDDFFDVPHQPTTVDIEEYAREVRERIRDLWKADREPDEGEERLVAVYLDAASPYNAMLIDYQKVMMAEEDIRIELPYLDSAEHTTNDPEALEVLRKLDERKQGDDNGKE